MKQTRLYRLLARCALAGQRMQAPKVIHTPPAAHQQHQQKSSVPTMLRAAARSRSAAAALQHQALHLRAPLGARRMAASAAGEGKLLTSDAEVQDVARAARTVAVLGIKTEAQGAQPAYFVPDYLQSAGVDIIPLPVFYPDVTHILGKPVLRKVSELQAPVDILVMFRKPSDLPAHLPDILQAPHPPRCVWLQSGITNAEFEAELVKHGFNVVADRCIMVEHRASQARSAL